MGTTQEDRQAALDAMAANAGQGRIALEPGRYQQTISPAIQQPMGARAQSTADAWAERNRLVAAAAQHMLGGYGSALNSARQQNETEWLRKYQEANKPTGAGRRAGGGGGDDTTSTIPTGDMGDEWAWLDEYLNQPATSAPSVNGRRPTVTTTAAAGQGRGAYGPVRPTPSTSRRTGNVRYS